jgi:hypothetical protein
LWPDEVEYVCIQSEGAQVRLFLALPSDISDNEHLSSRLYVALEQDLHDKNAETGEKFKVFYLFNGYKSLHFMIE